MNIAELMSQVYNFTMTKSSHSKMIRKYKKLTHNVNEIKSQFRDNGIRHHRINYLLSLMLAFKRNILHMKIYSSDHSYRCCIVDNTKELENSIIKIMAECNEIIKTYKAVTVRRHSF